MKRVRNIRMLALIGAFLGAQFGGCATTPEGGAGDQGADRLQRMEVRRVGPEYRIRVEGREKPTYTVFRLVKPMRVVIDLANYDVRALREPRTIEEGEIARIRGRQFGDDRLGIGRLEFTLRSLAEYDTWVDGNSLVISIRPVRAELSEEKMTMLTQSDDAQLLEEDLEGEDVLLEEEFIDDVPEEDLFGDDSDIFGEEDDDLFAEEEAVAEPAEPEAPAEEVEEPGETEVAEDDPGAVEVAEEDPGTTDVAAEEPPVAEPTEPVEDVDTTADAAAEPVDAVDEPAAEVAEPTDEFEELPADEDVAAAPEAPAEEELAEPPVAEPATEVPVETAEPADEFEELPEDVEPEPAMAAPAAPAETAPVEPAVAEPEPAPAVEEPVEVAEEPADEFEALPEDTQAAPAVAAAPATPPAAEPEPAPATAPGMEEPIDVAEEPDDFGEELPPIEEESDDERLAQETLRGVEGQDLDAMVAPAPATEEEPEPETMQASQLVDVTWDVSDGRTLIGIEANGPFGDYNAFKLEDPARIVVDVWNVTSLIPGETFSVDSVQVDQIRVGGYPEKVRVVLDVPGAEALPFTAEKDGERLLIEVTGEPVQPGDAVAEPAAEPEPVIEVAGQDVAEPEPEPQPATRPRTTPKPQPKEEVEPVPQPKQAQKDVGARQFTMQVEDEAKQDMPDAPEKDYTGRKISLDFKDADIDSVLRLIAEVSNLNIITDPEVSGTISIRLVNVPWDQALDVVLAAKQLGIRKMGNIVRIAPLDKLQKEDAERLKAMEDQENLLPLFIRVIPVNYAAAGELASRIEPLLSSRGSVDVDSRTNVLIIKDIQRNISDAVALIRSLDTPTPQVLIEAKIVEANTTFTRDLGVQWGFGADSSPEYGNSVVPGRLSVAGSSAGNVGRQGGIPNFAVDMPAAVGQGSGGALSFVFGSLDNSTILDLRLSALESSGEGRIISSPRVTTLDNEQATILQGISIPFQTVSASGTQTQFVDAALRLEVTPHITPDRSILLDFKISKNAPDQTFTAGTGVPSISKKEAESRMLVADGETAVVGGIFTIDRGTSSSRVPWLSKIPVIGWFFQKQSSRDTKTELLLFVTPRIVDK